MGKAPALNLLASLCDGLFFVGKLSLQIMNGFGIPVPSCFVEKNSTKEVLQLIQTAHNRNIPIYYPTDTWCLNNKNNNHEKLEILDSAELLPGEYTSHFSDFCSHVFNRNALFLDNSYTATISLISVNILFVIHHFHPFEQLIFQSISCLHKSYNNSEAF